MAEATSPTTSEDEAPAVKPASRYLVFASIDDAPHLSEQQRRNLSDRAEPHLKEARTKGIPTVGSGRVWPINEEDGSVVIPDFPLPEWWKRGYVLDPGWNKTAALWMAYDHENDIWYAYAEHYRGEAESFVHANVIKSRGAWMTGIIDPASRGRDQLDGRKMVETYRKHGLKLRFAVNAFETGLTNVWDMMVAGQLKIFRSCQCLLGEIRLYRRNEKGKVIEEDDHLCACLRYGCNTGYDWLTRPPEKTPRQKTRRSVGGRHAWMS